MQTQSFRPTVIGFNARLVAHNEISELYAEGKRQAQISYNILRTHRAGS